MSWLKTVIGEILGLFVDDGSFAIAIVVWLGMVRFLSVYVPEHAGWTGVMLFGGLVLILIESAMRRARR